MKLAKLKLKYNYVHVYTPILQTKFGYDLAFGDARPLLEFGNL